AAANAARTVRTPARCRAAAARYAATRRCPRATRARTRRVWRGRWGDRSGQVAPSRRTPRHETIRELRSPPRPRPMARTMHLRQRQEDPMFRRLTLQPARDLGRRKHERRRKPRPFVFLCGRQSSCGCRSRHHPVCIVHCQRHGPQRGHACMEDLNATRERWYEKIERCFGQHLLEDGSARRDVIGYAFLVSIALILAAIWITGPYPTTLLASDTM